MHCQICNGYGFYTVKKTNGASEGRTCVCRTNSILRQDLDTVSPTTRTQASK